MPYYILKSTKGELKNLGQFLQNKLFLNMNDIKSTNNRNGTYNGKKSVLSEIFKKC